MGWAPVGAIQSVRKRSTDQGVSSRGQSVKELVSCASGRGVRFDPNPWPRPGLEASPLRGQKIFELLRP